MGLAVLVSALGLLVTVSATCYKGTCFSHVATAMTFDAAEAYCRQEYSGHLASVYSARENTVVARLVQGGPGANFIGGKAITTGIKDFYWQNDADSKEMTLCYTQWNSREPNNRGGDPNEDCIEMVAGGNWNDISCNAERPFICEH